MNVRIIHDSQAGNGIQLAEAVQDVLQSEGNTVEISHVDQVDGDALAAAPPDLLIVGAAVRKFSLSGNVRAWLRKLEVHLKQHRTSIPAAAVFLTHGLPSKVVGGYVTRLRERLSRVRGVRAVYDTPITARVIAISGPFEPGTLERVREEAARIHQWAKEKAGS